MTNVSCVSDNYEDPLESLIIVVDMLVKRNWFSPNAIPYFTFRCQFSIRCFMSVGWYGILKLAKR
jgi:hypothetical protein